VLAADEVSEELVYEQDDSAHSPLTVRERGGGWDVSCKCGYETWGEDFEEALLDAETHLDLAWR
jgi:hypothetical protein